MHHTDAGISAKRKDTHFHVPHVWCSWYDRQPRLQNYRSDIHRIWSESYHQVLHYPPWYLRITHHGRSLFPRSGCSDGWQTVCQQQDLPPLLLYLNADSVCHTSWSLYRPLLFLKTLNAPCRRSSNMPRLFRPVLLHISYRYRSSYAHSVRMDHNRHLYLVPHHVLSLSPLRYDI